MIDGTPDTPDRSTSALNPPAVTYALAGAGALKCGSCGALVDDDRDVTDAHTVFHALLAGALDGLTARVTRVEGELAQADARIARDAHPDAPIPLAGGWAADYMLDAMLAGMQPAPGRVRLTVAGAVEDVSASAAGLGRLLPLAPVGPVVRDAMHPVAEARAYVADAPAIAAQVQRCTAALAGLRDQPRRIPAPATLETGDAVQIARHARAILSHLTELKTLAVDAGLPVEGAGDDLFVGEFDAFVAEVDTWVKGLDTWAESTAHKSGAPRELLDHTETWCHTPGGTLPLGGEAGVRRVRLEVSPLDDRLPDAEERAARECDDPGVVRVRLEGSPDDVELALELAESCAFPLADVSDEYVNRNRSGASAGHVRRYGLVNLAGERRPEGA